MSAERLTLSAIQSVVKQLSQSGLGEIEVNANHWTIKVTCCPTVPTMHPVSTIHPVSTLHPAYTMHPVSTIHPAYTIQQGKQQQDKRLQDRPRQIRIKAKAAGHFLRHHPSQEAEFIQVGDEVTKDQLIGLLKIGPVYLPVHSPCHGSVVAIHRDDGSVVGFDTELITINQ